MSATLTNATNLDLIRFLLARVDDDDAALKRLARQQSRAPHTTTPTGVQSVERQRAECVAKRRVIGSAQQLLVLRDQPSERPIREAAVQILRALAAPYADHASFRPEWRLAARS
jgi:hypothetical protein